MIKYICSKCNKVGCPYENKKALCPKTATSILCNTELLEENERLELVTVMDDNRYYYLSESNTCILNVENMYCIIIDHMVNNSNGKNTCLPMALSVYKYTMQRIGNRDWCRIGSRSIGEVIHRLVNGDAMIDSAKANGDQEDHRAETYNEKICNTQYGINPVEASHRVCVDIRNQKELNEFLDDLENADKQGGGVYYNKIKKKRIKRGRKFVFFR